MGNLSSTPSTSSPHITTCTELLYSSDDNNDERHNQKNRASQPIKKSNNPSTRVFPSPSSHTKLHYGSDDDSSSHNRKRKVSRLPVEIGSSAKDTSSIMSHSTDTESYQGRPRVQNSEISLSPSSSDENDASLTMIRNHSKCITNHSKLNSSAPYGFGSDSEEEAVNECAATKSTQKKGEKQNYSSNNEDDEDYEPDESADNDADIEEVMREILDHAHLVDMSFFLELQNYLIGIKEMKTSAIKTLYGRVSSFLGFVMSESNLKDYANRIYTQEEAIQILLEGDINVIERYIQVLKLDNNRRVGTCYNIVLDIKHWLDYMKVHENKKISSVIEFYMKLLRNLMKKKRKDLKKRLNRSELEKDLKFPKGGKKELIEIFEKKAPRVDNILQKLRKDDQVVSDKDRIFAYYWIVTHVFMHNPQARVGAITAMSVEDMNMLRTDEYSTSTHFKTSCDYR